ncbi:MAG: hypothetical protein PHW12_07130 [Smithella sp.]|nr:hypothetical protein [Smithella sp.]
MIRTQTDSSSHNFVGEPAPAQAGVNFLDVLQYTCGVSSLPSRYAVNNPFVNLQNEERSFL